MATQLANKIEHCYHTICLSKAIYLSSHSQTYQYNVLIYSESIEQTI